MKEIFHPAFKAHPACVQASPPYIWSPADILQSLLIPCLGHIQSVLLCGAKMKGFCGETRSPGVHFRSRWRAALMNALRLASAPSLPLSTPTLPPVHLSDATDHKHGPFHSPARACLIHAFQSHHVSSRTEQGACHPNCHAWVLWESGGSLQNVCPMQNNGRPNYLIRKTCEITQRKPAASGFHSEIQQHTRAWSKHLLKIIHIICVTRNQCLNRRKQLVRTQVVSLSFGVLCLLGPQLCNTLKGPVSALLYQHHLPHYILRAFQLRGKNLYSFCNY